MTSARDYFNGWTKVEIRDWLRKRGYRAVGWQRVRAGDTYLICWGRKSIEPLVLYTSRVDFHSDLGCRLVVEKRSV